MSGLRAGAGSASPAGSPDTVQDLALADNPGRWMIHCHNAYHSEAGLMTRLDYVM